MAYLRLVKLPRSRQRQMDPQPQASMNTNRGRMAFMSVADDGAGVQACSGVAGRIDAAP